MKRPFGHPAGLPQLEQFAIASALQAVVIDELFRATGWLAPTAVFHGGTALALARNSARFSEDLDFMVDERNVVGLAETIAKLQPKLELAMSFEHPRSSITIKGPRGKEVKAWQVVWSHPERRNTVMVKLEFFVTRAGALAPYRARHEIPSAKGAIPITTPIPVPELVAAWADKIKAVATRPDFKWRDAYDLWWIARCMRDHEDIADDERIEALKVSASLYDMTLEGIHRGLERVSKGVALNDLPAFEADMQRWFPSETYATYRAAGLFASALADARREIERARGLTSAGRRAR